jgi:hypothetical protein
VFCVLCFEYRYDISSRDRTVIFTSSPDCVILLLKIFDQNFVFVPCFSIHTTYLANRWDAAPCSLVESDRPLRDADCLHHQGVDGGSKHL